MFLATTSNTAFWDTDDELLFLGPWCMRYDRRHEWEGLKYQVLSNPWSNRVRLDGDIAYCTDVGNYLVNELTPYLNAVHGVSFSGRYWQILLGYWLHYYIHDLYSRFIHLRTALDLFPDIRTFSLASDCWLTPRDTAEFVRRVQGEKGDRHGLQLFSQLLTAMGCEAVTRSAEATAAHSSATPSTSSARWLWRGLGMLRRLRAAEIVLCDMNFGRRYVWAIVRGTTGKAWPLLERLPDDLGGECNSAAARKGLATLKGRNEFERALVWTLPHNFPTLYLEGYASARRFCTAGWNRPPKVLVSAVGWAFNEYFKFLAAECVERGSRLVGVQHGGLFGLSKALPAEDLEWIFTDRWYAWGWSGLAGHPKVRDLPYPPFSELVPAGSGGGSKHILYVSTEMPLSLGRVHSGPMGDQQVEYFSWRLRFVNALPQALADRLLVRLYPHDWGWNQAQRLRDAAGSVRLDDHAKSLPDRLCDARLAVFDHPGTALFEGLASGVPCLLFWNPRHWDCRPFAAPYLDLLRDAGVLLDDPVLAAAHLPRIHDDPKRWWSEPRVRAAREAFMERFARRRADWLDEWIGALKAEAALAETACL